LAWLVGFFFNIVKILSAIYNEKETYERSIQRTAWAMASNLLRQWRVTRKNVGWYNEAVSTIRKKVRKPISEKVAAVVARNTAKAITEHIGM
jgi:hypothetical protein